MKNILLILILFSAGMSVKAQDTLVKTDTIIAAIDSTELRCDSIIAYARSLKGIPYVWAGHTKKGLDCTGFVHYVYDEFGVYTPYSSKSFVDYGEVIPLEEAKVGDIMVFRGTNPSDKRPGHVGIIAKVTENELHFLHSSSSKKHFGVVETEYYSSGYPKRFLKVVRPN